MLWYPQRETLVWSTEKDALKKRLADSEAENMVSDEHLLHLSSSVSFATQCFAPRFTEAFLYALEQGERGVDARRAPGL